MKSYRVALGFLSSLASACGPIEPAGTPGALKEGGFVFCEKGDAPCSGTGTVPARIAVGSTFGIQFGAPFPEADDVTLQSSDETRLDRTAIHSDGSAGFRVLGAGAASVEARTTQDDRLLDFVRLNLAEIATLGVRICPKAFNAITMPGGDFFSSRCGGDPGESPNVDISLGSSLAPTLCSLPVDADSKTLGGHLDFAWTINRGATANLEMFVSKDGRCATIGGLTQGNATLTVGAGSASTEIPVTVAQ